MRLSFFSLLPESAGAQRSSDSKLFGSRIPPLSARARSRQPRWALSCLCIFGAGANKMPSSALCARMNAAAAAGAAPTRRNCELHSPSSGQRSTRSSSSPSSAPSPSPPKTPLALRHRRGPRPSSVAARAFFESNSDSGSVATASEDDGGARALLAYSQAVTADDVDFFSRAAPAEVVAAMSETVSGLLGSLACAALAADSRASLGGSASSAPPSFPASASSAITASSTSTSYAAFDVRVRARDADLGQLLYSTLMTGYLMRNAASRLRLRSRLSAGGGSGEGGSGGAGAPPAGLPPPPPPPPPPPASPLPAAAAEGGQQGAAAVDPTTLPPEARAAALASLEGTPRLAPGAQTRKVEGDVFKWDQSHGLVSVPAAAYIRALEAELASARAAAAAAAAALEKQSGENGKGAVALSAAAAAAKQLPAPSPSSPLSNPLLAYLRSADEASLTSLTAEASAGVLEAANAFVQRIMTGRSGGGALAAPRRGVPLVRTRAPLAPGALASPSPGAEGGAEGGAETPRRRASSASTERRSCATCCSS